MSTVLAPPPLLGRRMTLAEYRADVAAGAIVPADRVELLNGQLRPRTPVNPPHAAAVRNLDDELRPAFGPGFVVSVQCPLALPGRDSEPFPDVAVLVGPKTRYRHRHPTPADAVLVIEVAASSVAFDSGEKFEAYAAAGVPEYWVVDLADRRVDAYTDPAPAGYATKRSFTAGDAVPVPGTAAAVAVDSILP